MPTAEHRKFDLGMNRDIPPDHLPEGYLYHGENVLFDKPGIVRKRGGCISPTLAQSWNGDHMGALVKDDSSSILYALGVGAPIMKSINKTTGAFTTMGGANFGDINRDGGRPFQHYGFLIWPCYSANFAAAGVGIASAGGADGSKAVYTFATPASVVGAAGDKLITCAAGDNPLTNLQVGQIVVLVNTANNIYIGRVTRLVSTTSFEVYPTPTVAIPTCTSAVSYNGYTPSVAATAGQRAYIGGKVGMSFQGRVLLGDCSRKDTSGANRLELFPRRVYFSSTLLEGDTRSGPQIQGAVWLHNNAFPDGNYFDIPGPDRITAMSPTGFGDAVIFTPYRTFRLTGNLSTQYGTSVSITWQVREIPNSVGCISERSMQRTPRGIIFAADSGIYSTDGQSMRPLMHLTMSSFWKTLVGTNNFRITGSALINGNHYYITGFRDGFNFGTPGTEYFGLLVNLDTLAWSYITPNPNIGFAGTISSVIIMDSCQDPASPGAVYGLSWWDTSGAAPLMGAAQITRLDKFFTPDSTNHFDGIQSGSDVVQHWIITRPYFDGDPAMQKIWTSATIDYRSFGGTPAPGQNLTRVGFDPDPADMPLTPALVNLIKQDAQAISGATNATPIVVTIPSGHGIQVDDWVYVQNVLGNTAANGKWRVQAVTPTTVTLMGTSGNGAYTAATGTLSLVDQKVFSIASILATASGGNKQEGGGQCIEYHITGSNGGAPDTFELHGIAHSWEDREDHVQ